MIAVLVWAPVYPTEDCNRVQAAIESIFQGLEFKFHKNEGMADRLVGLGNKGSLVRLHEQLRSRMILDTGRSSIHIDGGKVCFSLNKQAAAAGKVSFPPDDETLGSIWVEIDAKTPEEAQRVRDWLAPPTEDGTPLFEIDL